MIVAALLVIFPFAMIYAAFTDLLSMTIENRVHVVLAIAFLVLAAATGMPSATLGLHVATALVCLTVTIGFFASGWMGGGDAKLIAVTALWFGPTVDFADYLLLSSVLGGVMTLALLSLRSHLTPTTGVAFMDRLLAHQTGVPYGIALGVAGLSVFSGSSWMSIALARHPWPV